ncbi:MAG: tol-pal system YbgF family protein [Vulcanimicrobiota bacterium]
MKNRGEYSVRTGVSALLALAVCLLLLSGAAYAGEEENLYFQGNSYLLQNQWDRAIESFNTLLKKYPSTKHVDSSFWIAYCHAEKGNYEVAIARFRDFVQKYPRNGYAAQALYKVGEINEKYLNDYEKAILAYKDVQKKFPESPEAYKSTMNTAFIREFKEKDFPGAISDYKQMMVQSDSRPDAYSGYREMAAQRIAFITQNSDNGYKPLRIYTQSSNYEEQGKLDKAIEGYANLILKYPQSNIADNAQFRLIKCWERKSVVPRMKEEVRKFLASYPGSEFAPQVKLLLQKYGE